jgi:hypothetical protein
MPLQTTLGSTWSSATLGANPTTGNSGFNALSGTTAAVFAEITDAERAQYETRVGPLPNRRVLRITGAGGTQPVLRPTAADATGVPVINDRCYAMRFNVIVRPNTSLATWAVSANTNVLQVAFGSSKLSFTVGIQNGPAGVEERDLVGMYVRSGAGGSPGASTTRRDLGVISDTNDRPCIEANQAFALTVVMFIGEDSSGAEANWARCYIDDRLVSEVAGFTFDYLSTSELQTWQLIAVPNSSSTVDVLPLVTTWTGEDWAGILPAEPRRPLNTGVTCYRPLRFARLVADDADRAPTVAALPAWIEPISGTTTNVTVQQMYFGEGSPSLSGNQANRGRVLSSGTSANTVRVRFAGPFWRFGDALSDDGWIGVGWLDGNLPIAESRVYQVNIRNSDVALMAVNVQAGVIREGTTVGRGSIVGRWPEAANIGIHMLYQPSTGQTRLQVYNLTASMEAAEVITAGPMAQVAPLNTELGEAWVTMPKTTTDNSQSLGTCVSGPYLGLQIGDSYFDVAANIASPAFRTANGNIGLHFRQCMDSSGDWRAPGPNKPAPGNGCFDYQICWAIAVSGGRVEELADEYSKLIEMRGVATCMTAFSVNSMASLSAANREANLAAHASAKARIIAAFANNSNPILWATTPIPSTGTLGTNFALAEADWWISQEPGRVLDALNTPGPTFLRRPAWVWMGDLQALGDQAFTGNAEAAVVHIQQSTAGARRSIAMLFGPAHSSGIAGFRRLRRNASGQLEQQA